MRAAPTGWPRVRRRRVSGLAEKGDASRRLFDAPASTVQPSLWRGGGHGGTGGSVPDRGLAEGVACGQAASAPRLLGDQEAVDLARVRLDPNEPPAAVRDEGPRARELPLVHDPDLVDRVRL